ncbi:MAG: response regulator [Anaerolineales bacterium]|nr:response regulator [Anaerolineales bacterium]
MTKILLIEDMPDTVELVRRALTPSGYEVFHAPDAETGLQMALAHNPDLILLDLGLPDYDGQTLAGWLRAESALDATPIIAFTAWPHETAKQMIESYGCNGYIAKPIVKVSDFVAQVGAYLKKHQ